MSIPTYAFHGSEDFNTRFHESIAAVSSDVEKTLGDNLVALVLGGGYGRGEGAVLMVDGEEQPYNDLDFLLVVERPNDVDQVAMAQIKKHHESLTPLHVDFTQPFTVEDIQAWQPWLMWFDFYHGHIVSAGDPEVLHKHVSKSILGTLDPLEASRLLINRGAGLLWAMRIEKGLEQKEDDDFIKRNFWKCALALGDALLIAHDHYSTPYRGRDQRVQELCKKFVAVAELGVDDYYPEALRFKFSPHEITSPIDLEAMGKLWVEVLLHIEERRFKREWANKADYASWKGLREPIEHVPAKWLRNVVKAYRLGEIGWRYPAEHLYPTLPFVLTNLRDPDWERRSDQCLRLWKGVMGVPIDGH